MLFLVSHRFGKTKNTLRQQNPESGKLILLAVQETAILFCS